MPCGATMMNATSSTPTIRTLISDEIVTVATSWIDPSRRAPTTGPYQVALPLIIGMAIALTAITRLKADSGST
jgi:hypothetical protein